jgi:hypothetical protein
MELCRILFVILCNPFIFLSLFLISHVFLSYPSMCLSYHHSSLLCPQLSLQHSSGMFHSDIPSQENITAPAMFYSERSPRRSVFCEQKQTHTSIHRLVFIIIIQFMINTDFYIGVYLFCLLVLTPSSSDSVAMNWK